MGSAYLLVGYNVSTPNPCQLGSPVWPYPVLAGYPKTLHLNDYVATMDGTIPLVVSFLALATGNLPQVLFGKGLHVPNAHVLCRFLNTGLIW